MTKIHKHGGDIYQYPNVLDFSSNCNPYGMPHGVKKAIIDSLEKAEHYPDVQCRALRKALEQHENVSYEQIICGNGAADLIFGLVLAKKPKQALLPAPTFAEYQQALEAVGCKIRYAPLREENGFIPEEAFIDQITEDLDMVFFCNPNNPTGVLVEQNYMRKIAEKCKKNQVFLVLDECFLDFIDNQELYSMKMFLNEFPNLFLLKAFTKKYAMPGLRLGYGFCSDAQVLEEMNSVMQPWNVSVLAQEAGTAALKEQEYVNRTMERIKEERKYLLEELSTLPLKIYSSKANYIFFQGPENFQKECMEQGIYIRDCSNYIELKNGFYRIAVRTREENEALIRIFKGILKDKQEDK